MAQPDPDSSDSLPGEDVGRSDQDVDRELEQVALAARRPDLIQPATPIAQPMLRPQPPGTRPSFVMFTSYTDYVARIQALMLALDQSFDRGDYLYGVDTNAYWKRKTQLDDIFDWVVSQIEKDSILSGVSSPALVMLYDAIEDGSEDWEDEVRKKARFIGATLGESGLALKERKPGFKAVPADAMILQVREDLEAWQIRPDEAGVVQVAELLVQAIEKRRLMVMLIDVDPFAGLAYGGGKSQLLWQILYWAHRLLGKTFDPRKDVVYRRDYDRLKRLFAESDRVPWGIDEFNQFYDKWEWNSKENKPYTYQLQMYRKVGRPIVGACGSLWETNERVRMQILTNRLSITKWDEDAFVGEAVLFKKHGPPAWQDEEENRWGLDVLRLKFNGLNSQQFRFYNRVQDRAYALEGKGGLDKFLGKAENADWLADLIAKDPPAISGKDGEDPIDWIPDAEHPARMSKD